MNNTTELFFNDTTTVRQLANTSNLVSSLLLSTELTNTENQLNTTLNQTSQETTECHSLYYCTDQSERYFFALDVTRTGILGLGILFNSIFFATIINNKKLWTTTFLYLFFLCFYDTIFLVMDACDFVFKVFTAENFCSWLYFPTIAQYGSLLTVTWIACDRYFAICRPFSRMGRRQSLKHGFLVLLIIFLASAILAVPEYTTICMFDDLQTIKSEFAAYVLFIVYSCVDLITYSVSLVIVVIAYGLIVFGLKKENSSTANEKRAKKRKNLIQMLIFNSAVYFICILPKVIDLAIYLTILFLKRDVSEKFEYHEWRFYQFTWVLVSINASVNSINGLICKDYRDAVANLGRMIARLFGVHKKRDKSALSKTTSSQGGSTSLKSQQIKVVSTESEYLSTEEKESHQNEKKKGFN